MSQPGSSDDQRRAEFNALEDEIVALLRQNRKIDAITLFRARIGVGLKEAKQAVEAVGVKHGIAPARGCSCSVTTAAILLVPVAVALVVW